MRKRPDEEKETLGFSKWKFSQKILTILADFSSLSMDYKVEHGEEENFVFLAQLLFYEFPEEKVSNFDLY